MWGWSMLGLLAMGCAMTDRVSGPGRTPTCYVAELATPAGPLPFILHFDGQSASVENGEERIVVPQVLLTRDRLELGFTHYASQISATWDAEAGAFIGTWTKRRGAGTEAVVPFRAAPGSGPRFARAHKHDNDLSGRYRVAFEEDDDPAVGLLTSTETGLSGTFLTTTGDYRYLAGGADSETMRLSCFDGAHAFLFVADRKPNGTLDGVFWSGDWWHTGWTAKKDPLFNLPDPFEQTEWNSEVSLGDLAFPDPEGVVRRLTDPEFAGKARIIQIFGSWCPNCHDASNYLRELHERYSEAGLSIVGLAFELTGDFETDRVQVVRSMERHGTPYPVLVAGLADKEVATQQLKALSFVKSYPTTIFLTGAGEVRAIHTGFTGPATGREYQKLRTSFERLIEELLESSLLE